ncbi:MAG TPA: S8 family serine peptidase, partial [Thermomicrobiales bacterium]|nr:S8 family serine peptidase [Thermomicrobiales bacterium]
MRRSLVLLLALLIALGGSAQIFAGAAARDRGGKRHGGAEPDAVRPAAAGDNGDVTNWYIVEVSPHGPDPGDVADRLTKSLGIAVSHVYRHGFIGFAANIPPNQVDAVKAAKNVRSVEPDEPVTVDGAPSGGPFAPCSDAGDVGSQQVPTGICRIQADKNATANIDGVDDRVNASVAVVDTGIDQDAANWDLNVQSGGIDCTGGNDQMRDGFGHGTHVAGTIGALDNHVGVVGVAPGVRIWSVKVFDDNGKGSVRTILCGLNWVLDQAANGNKMDVVNMSLATKPKNQPVDDRHCGKKAHDAFQKGVCRVVKAGITVVVAAGNDHANTQFVKPGAYRQAIAVAALSDSDGTPADDRFAGFSNYGKPIDLAAPGDNILSLYPSDLSGGSMEQFLSGTSMAAPHVTGA